MFARSQDGKICHRVLGRISSVRQTMDPAMISRPVGDHEPDDRAAFLTILKQDSKITTVTLNIRQALVDLISIGMLKIDFALAYCGLPIRENTPVTAYLSHVQQSAKIDLALDFWHTRFEGASVTRIAPEENLTSPPAFPDKYHNISLKLEPRISQQLLDLEANKICSHKCLFESIWALVLSQSTGMQDVVFACTERDRSFEGYNTHVGSLDQTYPVRVSLSEKQSFASLMIALERFHTEASQHGHLGHESILKASEMSRSESLLKYSNTTDFSSVAELVVNFPLVIFVSDHRFVELTISHTTKLNFGDAELILQHYSNAITDTLNKILIPDLTINEINMSSDAERNYILERATTFRSPEKTKPAHIAILFEAQVKSHPTAPAVQYEQDEPVTFSELNLLANQLAVALRIKTRTLVPVCMNRSVDLIVSLLAILKSGAAYVILDPEGAPRRNEHIVDECEAEIVLTDRQSASHFRQAYIVEDLRGSGRAGPMHLEHADVERNLSLEDPCYVIYTSGSTGTPKGVVLTHRAASSGMSHFSLNDRRRWLLFYNPIFSAAQRTMLATLVKGGCLLLASKSSLTTSLAKTIDSMQADALGITPSALSLISPSQVPTLKQITLVGEQVSQTLLDTWCERLELRNTFGLSECTQLNFGTRLGTNSNPRVVGQPSDTTIAYILKTGSTELAPLDVAGELCLAGPQLASGYLRNPEQTARVFIENPFGPGKLYRTGDAARQHRDGAIEIVGRLDFQIKINGQRIEPNEINKALLRHSSLQACATVAASMGDTTSLVTAIVPTDPEKFKGLVTELRQHAEKLLPSYMIPSYWMLSEVLPMNINGKIDVSRSTYSFGDIVTRLHAPDTSYSPSSRATRTKAIARTHEEQERG